MLRPQLGAVQVPAITPPPQVRPQTIYLVVGLSILLVGGAIAFWYVSDKKKRR